MAAIAVAFDHGICLPEAERVVAQPTCLGAAPGR